jgi:hypothetical protein
MLRYSFQFAVCCGILCVLLDQSSLSHASVIVAGDIVRIGTDQGVVSGSWGGGEFALYKKSGPGDEDWEFVAKTFCLERTAPIETGRDVFSNEYFQYVVGAVSDRAIDDGSNAAPGKPANTPDYLSAESRFLYYAFQAGFLDTFDLGGGVYYQYNDADWAQSLQNAIWVLEEEGVYGSEDEALLISLANAQASNYSNFNAGVLALNLFLPDSDLSGFDIDTPSTWNAGSSLDGKHIQDLLWFTPPPNPVPNPAPLTIWSILGLGGAGLLARRRLRHLT